ncbi:MAG: hypothetical protein Q8P41_00585 [Pseudomonadota bacterium]|nr:hypothetical protein [Pseudomonadota bacterium]
MSDPRTVPTQQLFRQWRGGDGESGQNMAQRFSDWYYAVTSSRLGDAHGRVPLQNSCTRFQQGIVSVTKEGELVAWAHDILAEELKAAGGRIPGGDFPNQITGGRSPTELLALAKAALPPEDVRLLAHTYDSAWPLDELTKEAEGLGGMPLAVLRARYALKRWLQQNMGIGFTEVPDEPNLDYAPLPLYEASRMTSATEETNFEKWLLSNMGLCKDIAEFGVFALALRGGAFKAAAASSPSPVAVAPKPAPVPTASSTAEPAPAPSSGTNKALLVFGVVAALGLGVLLVVTLLGGLFLRG